MGFVPLHGEGSFFWSLEGAWGRVTVEKGRMELQIIEGELTLRELLAGSSMMHAELRGRTIAGAPTAEGFAFEQALYLSEGDVLTLRT